MGPIKIEVEYAGRIADILGRKGETVVFPEAVDVRTLMDRIVDETKPVGETVFYARKGSARRLFLKLARRSRSARCSSTCTFGSLG